MSILVTGIAGQVGSNVARMLVERGVEVVGIDVNPPMPHSVILDELPRIEFETADIGDLDQIVKIVRKYNVTRIIHTAAIVAQHADMQPIKSSRVNIEGTLNLLEACRICELERVVCLSSSAAAGNHRNYIYDRALSEDQYDVPFEGMYGLSKFVNENHVYLYRKLWSLPVIACRPVRIWGPGFNRWDLPPVIEEMIRDAINGGPVNVPRSGAGQPLEYTYVKDHCAGLIRAALIDPLPESCIFNLGSGRTYTESEIAHELLRTFPGLEVVMLDASPGERTAGSYVVANRPALDIGNATAQLGHVIEYGLERGIPAYVTWLTEHRYI